MHIYNILHRVLVPVARMGRASVRRMGRVKVCPRCRGSGARGVEAQKEEPAFALRICCLYQSSWGRGGARRGMGGRERASRDRMRVLSTSSTVLGESGRCL